LNLKLLIVAFFLSCVQASAQVFPIQGSVTLTPPYSPYLTNLTAPGAQRLMLNLRVNDPSLNDYACKLRITIDGVGITLRTRPSFVPQPITLPGGGIPQILYGEDIADYFNPVSLDFAGISRREFEKTNRLPEGIYRFSIEVLDYNRGTVVSSKFFATAWVILNDPPLLNLPRHATKVSILDPTNIAFTWTPRHTASPNAAFSTEYIFKLVELPTSSLQLPASGSQPAASSLQLAAANQALLTQPPLYEVVTDQSSLVYGPGEPALIPGRLYAWQVQAKDLEGNDLFKNAGKSEVFLFQFGDALGVPQNLGSDDRNANVIMLHWDAPIQGDMPEYYRIQYKPEFSDRWYDVRSRPNQRWHNVPDLKPDTKYVLRVRSEKGKQASEYSAPLIVSTAKEGEDYQCGAPSTPSVITSSGPVFKLFPGDTITMAKFPVIIIDVKGGNGFFEGTGWMIVKPFHGSKARIKFNGKINNDRQLDGLWETISTGQSEIGNFLETLEKIGEDRRKALLEESDSALNAQLVSPAIPINIVGVIEAVVINNAEEIVITKEDGSTETIAQPVNEQTKEKETIILTDAGGTQYRVETKDGKTSVTKIQGGSAGGTGNVTAQADPIKDRIIVLILEQFEKEIASWLATNGKGGEEDKEIMRAATLLASFPENANIRQHIHDYTIPYYKERPAELRSRIETQSDNKALFDQLKGKLTNVNTEEWDELSEPEKEGSKSAVSTALVEADLAALDTEISKTLVNPAKNCYDEGWKRGREVYGRYDFKMAVYAGILRYWLCETEKENCNSTAEAKAFGCGFSNGLLQELDWVVLLEAAEDVSKIKPEEILRCVIQSYPIGGRREDNPEFDDVLFKCLTGVEMGMMIDAIKQFIAENWTEAYYQGQATAFVLTLLSPLKAKILAKLKTLPQYASKLAKLEKLATAKNADELLSLSKTLAKGGAIVKRVGVNKFGTTEVAVSKVQKIHGVPKKGTPPNHVDDLANDFKTNGYNLESGPPIEGYTMPDGQVIIIDGHHRLAALEKLGETNIPIRIHSQISEDGLRLYLKIGEYSGFYPPSRYPSSFKIPDLGAQLNNSIDAEALVFVNNNFK
jgi:hypothetical protein